MRTFPLKSKQVSLSLSILAAAVVAACGGGGGTSEDDASNSAADQSESQRDAAGGEVHLTATAGATTDWQRIAVEGSTFTVSGTQVIRYGTGSSWIQKTITGALWAAIHRHHQTLACIPQRGSSLGSVQGP